MSGRSEEQILLYYNRIGGGASTWLTHIMNKGIALATGDDVGILNADDFYLSKVKSLTMGR